MEAEQRVFLSLTVEEGIERVGRNDASNEASL